MIASAALAFLRKFWPEFLIVACVAAMTLIGYQHGVHVTTAKWQADVAHIKQQEAEAQARAVAQAAADAKANAEAGFAAERDAMQRQQATQETYKTITNTVTRYVQSKPDLASCGLDARGLCLWNAANAGRDPAAACADPSDTHPVVSIPATRPGR